MFLFNYLIHALVLGFFVNYSHFCNYYYCMEIKSEKILNNDYELRHFFKLLLNDDLNEAVEKRLLSVVNVVDGLERRVKNPPTEHLRISKKRNNPQYYLITKPGDTHGKYLSKKKKRLAQEIAQKEYEMKVLRELRNQEKCLREFQSNYQPDKVLKLYTNLSEARQQLIQPIADSASRWVSVWLNVPYVKKDFLEEEKELYTSAGVRVRSKSELLIAETLSRMRVPFRYEFPVKLKKYYVHPDFYCLNVRTGKEIVWEHFGMMDDPEYSKRAVLKIEAYELSGWHVGKNFVMTFETNECQLSVKKIEETVKQYLL